MADFTAAAGAGWNNRQSLTGSRWPLDRRNTTDDIQSLEMTLATTARVSRA